MSEKIYLFWILIAILITPKKCIPFQDMNFSDISQYYRLLARTGALEPHPMLKHVASVKFKDHETSYAHNHICGGILISDRTIVTAGHCLLENRTSKLNPDDLEVAAGFTMGTFEDKGLQKLPVSKIELYPGYLPGTYRNDLAIIITEGSFDIIKNRLQIVDIPDDSIKSNKRCSVLGFGVVYYKNTKFTQILEDEVKVWPEMYCFTYLKIYRMKKLGKFCAGDIQSATSHINCTDLGSEPMICDDKAFGLLLLNIGCDTIDGYSGIFLDLPFYKSWILSHAEGNILLSATQGPTYLSNIIAVLYGVLQYQRIDFNKLFP